jgi:hypothetical protein
VVNQCTSRGSVRPASLDPFEPIVEENMLDSGATSCACATPCAA